MLMCHRCVGTSAANGYAEIKSATALNDDNEAASRAAHPEWFAPPADAVIGEPPKTEPLRCQAHTLASIMDVLKANDIRKQMDELRGQLAGLKVLLRVAEARDKKKKPRKPKTVASV